MTKVPPLIVHIITGLQTGGAELMLFRLIRESKGFRHVVISLTGSGPIGREIAAHGIEVIALELRPGLAALPGILRLARAIRRFRPALVQTWLYHADLLGTLAALLGGCRNIIWTLRCSDMDRKRYGRLVWLLSRLSAVPKAVLTNSRAGRAWHERMGYHPRAWHLVPNGFDTTRFRPDTEARTRWRKLLGFAEDTLLVGMVARVDPMKNHASFVAAAREISAMRPDIAFLMAGRGTEELAEDHVIGLGQIDDVAGLNAALDIFVLASRFGEGFPNVVAEAMACGVAVIATDSGDAALIIGDSGITVPEEDDDALREAILRLVEAPETRARLGAKARQKIASTYDLAGTVAAFEAVWRCTTVETG